MKNYLLKLIHDVAGATIAIKAGISNIKHDYRNDEELMVRIARVEKRINQIDRAVDTYYLSTKEGWSDSIINTTSMTIHYYRNGISLCGLSKIDLGNKHFEKGIKNLSDAYSHHCKKCIKKQNK